MTERRSKLEILQTIKLFFDDQGHKPFYKSDLKSKGIDPGTAEDFLKIIIFCQRELPFLEVTDFGKRFILKENNIINKNLDINEFLQLKEELIGKKEQLTPIDMESKLKLDKEMWTMTYNSDPILLMKFICQECDFSIIYPDCHGEQMDYNYATNQLECYFCKAVHPVPIHHDKQMKIVIIDQRDNKHLFKFISPFHGED